jgi:anti-sigma B factor antagonist
MKFSTRKEGDVTVFDLKGSLEGGPDTYAIKDEVKTQLDGGGKNFLFNMDDVGFVNSTGIGIMTSVYSSITGNGGRMKICNANSKVSKIMMITKLLEVFDSYYEEEEALRAFRGE